MGYKLFHRKWRSTRGMYYMMIPELLGTIGALVVTALAQPDLYRTKLWRAGSELGFNSSPSVTLWAYANNEPQPRIPFVWSQTLTDFTVAIAVLSLFLLLTKLVAFIMHVWYPILALVINIALLALYITSIAGQAGPDYLDPDHPSPVAWYIAKPCTVAANQTVQGYCKMAKGSFAIACIMLAIYVINLGMNVWAMLPNPKNDLKDEDDEETSSPSALKRGGNWEMHGIPPTPRTGTLPYTPRTMAFNTLESKLPLRQQYA
ncbi:hypothetical protein F5Y11DRAFT_296620 [Daldinia sp. FL1419]|nr:hypothetical protein F5Y11DRAFT_296620 [Daldinia sp. FL1419]